MCYNYTYVPLHLFLYINRGLYFTYQNVATLVLPKETLNKSVKKKANCRIARKADFESTSKEEQPLPGGKFLQIVQVKFFWKILIFVTVV